MNHLTYNVKKINEINKIKTPHLDKYIDEYYQHHGRWEYRIYKLNGDAKNINDINYTLIDCLFDYEKASNKTKEIMNQYPKMKERVIAFLNTRKEYE
ncbi:hypothetical protein [Proteus sp. G2666]|uniref:hypothetical protein n=1 Tax=Proteus sp. G2666 TaxID=2698879 RepID=UPI001378A6ED|nr:hypothetical protein [Proteus sp. G2666]NBM50062.1 hypothetical protein [Proteus sp. G2666]